MSGGREQPRGAHHAPPSDKTKARPRGSAALAVIAAAAVVLAAGGLIWWETGGGRPAAEQGTAAIGGPFHMLDQNGRPVDQSVLNGKWTAVFFGYTYCPDVCPATLQTLAEAYKRMGPNAKDFQVLFVSVDPARDHPAEMKAYIEAQALPMPTLGLSGTPDQVAAFAKAYKAYYAKVGTGKEYTMDHSAVIYLMNPQGRFVAPLAQQMGGEQIAALTLRAEGRTS